MLKDPEKNYIMLMLLIRHLKGVVSALEKYKEALEQEHAETKSK